MIIKNAKIFDGEKFIGENAVVLEGKFIKKIVDFSLIDKKVRLFTDEKAFKDFSNEWTEREKAKEDKNKKVPTFLASDKPCSFWVIILVLSGYLFLNFFNISMEESVEPSFINITSLSSKFKEYIELKHFSKYFSTL